MPAVSEIDLTSVVFPAVLAVVAVIAALGVMWKSLRTPAAPTVVLADGEVVDSAPLPPELPVGTVPVGFYRPLDLLGVAFVFLVFALLAIASTQAKEPAVDNLAPEVLVVNIFFQFMIAGIVALTLVFRTNVIEWLGLRWPRWYLVFLIGPGAVIGMWLLFGGLQVAGYMKWLKSMGVDQIQDSVELLQKSNNPVTLALMAATAVLVAPVCEEIVFRGYLYPILKRFSGVWVAGLCSALLFSCAHGNLVALLPLFIFGIVQVVTYEKTGSLWAPIAIHFCFNSASVLVQMAIRYFDIPVEMPS